MKRVRHLSIWYKYLIVYLVEEMLTQAVQVPFFYLVGLYVGWQFIRRNSRNGGMAEWRNGGMAEWRNGGQNGGMAERMAEWWNGGNGHIRTLVACRKTNPSLS